MSCSSVTVSSVKGKAITLVSLTDAGLVLSEKLVTAINSAIDSSIEVNVLHKPSPFKQVVQNAFVTGNHLVFICATGIVIRTLADVLDSKQKDPAVIVLDEMGRFVIPLLSGHQGGANELAAQIAEAINGQLILTTANKYLAPYYTVGMGCERGCSKSNLMSLLQKSLMSAGLELSEISCIASIDIKNDEVGLIELANELNLPFICYDVNRLREVESQLTTPSDYVFKTVGVYGVAESAALVSAQYSNNEDAGSISELVLAKQKSKVATCSIARSYRS